MTTDHLRDLQNQDRLKGIARNAQRLADSLTQIIRCPPGNADGIDPPITARTKGRKGATE